MCLYVNHVKTSEAKNRVDDIVIRYKVVNVQHDVRSLYYDYLWQLGWNKANYPDKIVHDITPQQATKQGQLLDKRYRPRETINDGIHVFVICNGAVHFVTQSEDTWHAALSHLRFRVMEVKCHKKDLIAVGEFGQYESEVYTQVYVEKLPPPGSAPVLPGENG